MILDLRKVLDLNLSYWLAFDQSPSWLPFSINALSMWNVGKFIWPTREVAIFLRTFHRKIIRPWKLVPKLSVLNPDLTLRIRIHGLKSIGPGPKNEKLRTRTDADRHGQGLITFQETWIVKGTIKILKISDQIGWVGSRTQRSVNPCLRN